MEEKKCPHIDCLVYHDGKPCTCNMARWCSKCGGEFASPEEEKCVCGKPLDHEIQEMLDVGVKTHYVNQPKESLDKIANTLLAHYGLTPKSTAYECLTMLIDYPPMEDKILSIIQDGKDKGLEAETILQSIKSELTAQKYGNV